MNIAARYALALLPQFAALAFVVAREEWTRSHGQEVRLEVRNWDPMDILSGRYIAVPLAISRLSLVPLGAEDTHFENGGDVYVTLMPGEPTWKAAAVTSEMPHEGVFLHGTATSVEPHSSLMVEYGLDRFFIPDGGADPARHKLTAVLRVTAAGHASLVDMLVEGEPYASWNAKQKAAH